MLLAPSALLSVDYIRLAPTSAPWLLRLRAEVLSLLDSKEIQAAELGAFAAYLGALLVPACRQQKNESRGPK